MPEEPEVMQSVLVAEDERNIATSLRFLMQQAGFEVRIAPDGPSVLELVEEKLPDLVLLDLMIPGFDGFEVLKRLREKPAWRHLPVFVISAKGRDIDRQKAFDLGAKDFVTKPYSTRELVKRVKKFLSIGEEVT
jgi:DNA-binding response OmpR family regulator